MEPKQYHYIYVRQAAEAPNESSSENDNDTNARSNEIHYTWTHQNTLKLIHLRGKFRHLFTGKKGSASKGYSKIAEAMGFSTDKLLSPSVKKKWENIIDKYRQENKKIVGTELESRPVHLRSSWKFYKVMYDTFGLGLERVSKGDGETSCADRPATPYYAPETYSPTPGDPLVIPSIKMEMPDYCDPLFVDVQPQSDPLIEPPPLCRLEVQPPTFVQQAPAISVPTPTPTVGETSCSSSEDDEPPKKRTKRKVNIEDVLEVMRKNDEEFRKDFREFINVQRQTNEHLGALVNYLINKENK